MNMYHSEWSQNKNHLCKYNPGQAVVNYQHLRSLLHASNLFLLSSPEVIIILT